jgi:hypothetical protein
MAAEHGSDFASRGQLHAASPSLGCRPHGEVTNIRRQRKDGRFGLLEAAAGTALGNL